MIAAGNSATRSNVRDGINQDFLLGAARPLAPSADIGPGGQSVGQAAQLCLGRLALQVFRIKPVGEKPESAGLAPHSPWAQCDLLIRDQPSRRGPCASAFLTSDCEIPNCLAIADGLTPALKAARTAFSLPVVNEPAPSSPASWRRCGFASATRFSFAGSGGRRPRRTASVVTAASSPSISTSSNCFSAPAKSVGKKWRCCEARLSGPALPLGTAGTEKRSGVVSAGCRVGIPQLCRRWLTAATACRATAGTHQHMRPWRVTRPGSWSQARCATKEANLIQVAPRDDCRRLSLAFRAARYLRDRQRHARTSRYARSAVGVLMRRRDSRIIHEHQDGGGVKIYRLRFRSGRRAQCFDPKFSRFKLITRGDAPALTVRRLAVGPRGDLCRFDQNCPR